MGSDESRGCRPVAPSVRSPLRNGRTAKGVNLVMATIAWTGILIACGVLAGLPTRAQGVRSDPDRDRKIARFAEVDNGIYKGSPPRSNADYRFLQSLHIRYILVMHFWPVLPDIEKRKARKYGISVISAFLPASPLEPSETEVARILSILRSDGCRPIYLHCTLGRDRTSLIAALYQVYFRGMSHEDGLEYMKRSGYRDSWLIGGLRRYFESHSTMPSALSTSADKHHARTSCEVATGKD